MAWVKQAPVKPGHYWWKQRGSDPVVLEIVRAITSSDVLTLTTIPVGYRWLLTANYSKPEDLKSGEWWDEPLTPPAYEKSVTNGK